MNNVGNSDISTSDLGENDDVSAIDSELDMLNILASGEDEFDVDLMACGCRLATTPTQISIHDLVRMFQLGESELTLLVGALQREGGIAEARLFELADQAAKGDIKEPERDEPKPMTTKTSKKKLDKK